MKKILLLIIWGFLFLLCAILGFLPNVTGVGRVICTILSLLFFVPGGMLLWQSHKSGDVHTIRLIRNLSILSLALSVVFLVANVLAVFAPQFVGDMLHVMLVFLSAPMFCSHAWGISLFLWAVLLFSAIQMLPKKKKK